MFFRDRATKNQAIFNRVHIKTKGVVLLDSDEIQMNFKKPLLNSLVYNTSWSKRANKTLSQLGMQDKYSFHENRYKIANAIGLVFIIVAIYLKKDLLYMAPNVTTQTLETPAEKIDKRPYVSPAFPNRMKDSVEQERSRYFRDLSMFQINPLVTEEKILIPIMCNSTATIIISDEFSLNNLNLNRSEKTVTTKIIDAKTIPSSILNSISRSYLNDRAYVCRIDNNIFHRSRGGRVMCRYFHIIETDNNGLLTPFQIRYIKEGYGPFLNCGNKAVFSYEIRSDEKLIKEGIINATIGDGSLPFPIERGLLNSSKGAVFEIEARQSNISAKIFNLKQGSDQEDKMLIFKIKL